MNKKEFLNQLSRKLRGLPKVEFDDALNYYTEYFLDAGVSENEDVIPLVGTVDEVAKKIIDEATDKQIVKAKKEGGVKNNSQAIWLIILGILAAPAAIPIVFVAAILIFVAVVVIGSLLFAAVVTIFALIASGFGTIPLIFGSSSVPAAVLAGKALLKIGVGIIGTVSIAYGVTKLAEVIIATYEKKKNN
ncbi:MAG: DUF1700 domain-containing protein [Lachnospiraceae bacterium]|nr:DUF1700 domain-containing protein [Lachnospiraceae bacterium]